MLERYREKLDVKNDTEWEIIRARIENIYMAERDLRLALSASTHRISSPKDKSGRTGHSSSPESSARSAEPGADSDVVALKQMVEGNAPAKDMKARLDRVRQMLRQKRENLENAQEELRTVLSVRQEAIAVLNGLLR